MSIVTTYPTANGSVSAWGLHIPTQAEGIKARVRLHHADGTVQAVCRDDLGAWTKWFDCPEALGEWLDHIAAGPVLVVGVEKIPLKAAA